MGSNKRRQKKYLSRLLGEEGNLIHYKHEELFGDGGAKIDILFTSKASGGWDAEARKLMPDGLRHSNAEHIIINFAYDLIDTDLPFIRTLANGILYREEHDLSQDDVLLALAFTKHPDPRILDELEYYPTKRPGIYRSRMPIFSDQIVMVLDELSNTLWNASFKCFSRSQKSRQDAYKLLAKHDFPGYPAHMREALAMIAELTEEEVDNFNSPDNDKSEGLMAAMMGPSDDEDEGSLDDVTSEEMVAAVEAYLREQL